MPRTEAGARIAQLLCEASTAVERHARITDKDYEECAAKTKEVHEACKAALVFRKQGITDIDPATEDPGPPLPFDAPAPAEEEPITPTPAELLKSWEGWDEAQREEMFDVQLVELSKFYAFVTEAPEPLDVTPYLEAKKVDPTQAFQWVLYALDQEYFKPEPDPAGIADWIETLDAPEPDEFDTYTEEEREESLKLLLDKLETEGLEQGDLALKDWKKAEKVFRAAWAKDPKDTYTRLTFAAYHRPRISWDIPTDEEMAPANFVDPMETLGGEA